MNTNLFYNNWFVKNVTEHTAKNIYRKISSTYNNNYYAYIQVVSMDDFVTGIFTPTDFLTFI